MMPEELQEVYIKLLMGYQVIQIKRDGNIIQFEISGYNRVRRSKPTGVYGIIKNATYTLYEVSPQGIKRR